jgi:hypothetical protein
VGFLLENWFGYTPPPAAMISNLHVLKRHSLGYTAKNKDGIANLHKHGLHLHKHGSNVAPATFNYISTWFELN